MITVRNKRIPVVATSLTSREYPSVIALYFGKTFGLYLSNEDGYDHHKEIREQWLCMSWFETGNGCVTKEQLYDNRPNS